MSEENVEAVQRGVEDVEVFWDLLDEYVVWVLRDLVPGLDPMYVGRDAVIQASRRWWGAWTDYSIEAEEIIDAGSGVVVVLREQGRGKGSGAPFDRRFAQVWTFQRGRVIRWEILRDKAAALAAVGG
jgi:ketosteroid isomerase-like protein